MHKASRALNRSSERSSRSTACVSPRRSDGRWLWQFRYLMIAGYQNSLHLLASAEPDSVSPQVRESGPAYGTPLLPVQFLLCSALPLQCGAFDHVLDNCVVPDESVFHPTFPTTSFTWLTTQVEEFRTVGVTPPSKTTNGLPHNELHIAREAAPEHVVARHSVSDT